MSVDDRRILHCGDPEKTEYPALLRACDRTWGELADTEEVRVRYCQDCDHFVHRVANVVEARVRARQGECLAVPVEIFEGVQQRGQAQRERVVVGMFDPGAMIDDLLQE